MSALAPARPAPTTPRLVRTVVVAAWTVPVLVLVQFAMLAVVPVALVLAGTVRVARPWAFRGWALLLTAAYAVPLVLRATGPNPDLSLSKSMGPVVTMVLVAVSLAVAVALSVLARRRGSGGR